MTSSKRRKQARKKRTVSIKNRHKTTEDSVGDSTSLGSSSGHTVPGGHRYDGLGAHSDSGDGKQNHQDPAVTGELKIDVIPTSSSKRCHSATVSLRATVDAEVKRQRSYCLSPKTMVASIPHDMIVDTPVR